MVRSSHISTTERPQYVGGRPMVGNISSIWDCVTQSSIQRDLRLRHECHTFRQARNLFYWLMESTINWLCYESMEEGILSKLTSNRKLCWSLIRYFNSSTNEVLSLDYFDWLHLSSYLFFFEQDPYLCSVFVPQSKLWNIPFCLAVKYVVKLSIRRAGPVHSIIRLSVYFHPVSNASNRIESLDSWASP